MTMSNAIRKFLFPALFMVLVLACSVEAKESKGYFALRGGAVMLNDAGNKGTLGTFNFSYKTGFSASAALGLRLGKGSSIGKGRMELEGVYSSTGIETIEFTEGDNNGSGDVTQTSFLLNSIAEYPTRSVWTPYLGIGAGWTFLELKDVKVSGEPLASSKANAFCYQFIIGSSVDVSHNLHFELDYRYLATLKPTFTDVKGRDFESEYGSHNLMAGIRIEF